MQDKNSHNIPPPPKKKEDIQSKCTFKCQNEPNMQIRPKCSFTNGSGKVVLNKRTINRV